LGGGVEKDLEVDFSRSEFLNTSVGALKPHRNSMDKEEPKLSYRDEDGVKEKKERKEKEAKGSRV
jgi:hypothetical protein